MTNQTLKLSIALAATLAAAACNDRPEIYEKPLVVHGPFNIDKRVMWVDGTRGRVTSLDPLATAPTTRSVGISRNVSAAVPSNNGKELLILTGGKEALRKDQKAEDPALTVIAASAKGPEVKNRYPLPSAFDQLAVSADGRFVVAHYSSKTNQNSAVFRNPNEIALLDLKEPPSKTNPIIRTLRSFGSAPLGVVFSPSMKIPVKDGPARTLALVLSRNYITFVDMDKRTRKEITLPLIPAGSTKSIMPQQVLFAPKQARVFIRATGAADIYAVALEAKTADGNAGNDYRPQINQPSAGNPIDFMTIYDDPATSKTMILGTTGTNAVLIDADTSEFTTIKIGEPVDTIIAIPAEAPTQALLYSSRLPRSRIHILSLERLDERREANLTSRTLANEVREVLAMPDNKQALVVHDDNRAVVSILDLVGEHRTDTPIQGRLPLTNFGFIGKSHLVGVAPGNKRVGIIDLANLHATDLRLDHSPQRVVVIDQTIVVDHGSLLGLATIIPKIDAGREKSRVLWGFLFDGLLDRGLKD